MLKPLYAFLLALIAFPTFAQDQSQATITYCQDTKEMVEAVHRLRQEYTRQQLEPMLVDIGIDLNRFSPFLDGAYAMPIASDPTELEMYISGIGAVIYVNCLESDGFKNSLPQ